MADQSEFFIIAGPNGAGKSTNGHFFVPEGLSVFNGDLVFADLVKKYPHIEPVRLQGGVAFALETARDKALAERVDFAFESNYSSDMATEISEMFKAAGYRTNLIYFGLENLKRSAARVEDRKATGGHPVNPDVIKYNFEEGVVRVNKDLHLFDRIQFVDTQQNAKIISLLQNDPKRHLTIAQDVNWYKKNFEEAIKRLKIEKEQVPEIRMERPARKRGLGH